MSRTPFSITLPIDIGSLDRSLGEVLDGRERGSVDGVPCCGSGVAVDAGDTIMSDGRAVDAAEAVGVAGGSGRGSSLTAGARR